MKIQAVILGVTRAVFGLVLAVAMVVPATAQSALDGQPAIRNKVQLYEGRHLLSPIIGTTLNDAYRHNLLGGLAWRYYPTNWLGVGVDVMGGFALETGLSKQISRELSTEDSEFVVEASSLTVLATACAEFVPFEGKFMLAGGHSARMSAHLSLGLGMALISGEGRLQEEISFMPMAGIGLRFFPSDWAGIGVELRNYIVERVLSMNADGSTPGARYDSNWFVGLSAIFVLPPRPKIVR